MGVYTLEVENESGADTASFNVIIVDKPDPPPAKPKVTDVSKNSIRLSWQTPDYDGGAAISTYIIEKCEMPSDTWVSCGSSCLTQMTVRRLKECKVLN